MATTVNDRVRNYRERMRAAGFRPIQIWVPDTRRKGFSEELKRQALLLATSDQEDCELQDFMDTAFDEVEGAW